MEPNGFGHNKVHNQDEDEIIQETVEIEDNEEVESVVSSIIDRYVLPFIQCQNF